MISKLNITILYYLFILCLACCCKQKASSKAIPYNNSEKFEMFADSFFNDSIFQQQRILYPLQGRKVAGLKRDPFSVKDTLVFEDTLWGKDEIPLNFKLRVGNYIRDTAYVDSLQAISEYVSEQPATGRGYYFKLIKGKWYLLKYKTTPF